jgi:signal transduction histidine kinase
MAAACLRLEMLSHDLADPAEQEHVEAIAEKVGLAVGRLRRLVFDLSPRGVESGGLVEGIEAYLREVGSEAGFDWHLDGEATADLSNDVKTILYRVAQEAIRNAQKHASPASVRIELGRHDGGTVMRIVDDGVGFAADVAQEHRPGHMGLLSMRERAALAGGTFRLESAPGEGCTVEVWVPDVASEPGG